MAPDCFPVQGMEEREEEGNLENVKLGGIWGGNSFWVEINFEWKFILGGNSWVNSLTVWVLLTRSVEEETRSAITKLLLRLLLFVGSTSKV